MMNLPRTKIVVGNFEADLDGLGRGTVTVNGKTVKLMSGVARFGPGKATTLELEILPSETDDSVRHDHNLDSP